MTTHATQAPTTPTPAAAAPAAPARAETAEVITGTRVKQVTLRVAAAEFWRHPSPWIMASVLLGALAVRVLVGGWAWSDLIAPAVLIASFPLIEWIVHVFILHWRPRRVGRFTVDTLLASKHRAHHRDPRNVPLVFIPWQTLIGLAVLTVLVPLYVFPSVGMGLTFMIVYAAVGMVYEWIHYLVHTDYKPKGRAYKSVWRHHRLHHFKNENYWMTVTTAHTADRLLGTDPDPATVPTSKTAKNLHGLASG